MPSFDIVSNVDIQKLDNTVNVVRKEVTNRFDFKDSNTTIELNKKDFVLSLETQNPMGIQAIEDLLMTRAIKQGIDGRAFDFTKETVQSGKVHRKTIKVVAGLDMDNAKKVTKIIKDSKLKVSAAIMDDQVRVTGKKIDDLQEVIAMLRKSELDIPLQFVNMKS
jgi:cyclic-di-GMP-binding protein